MHVTAIHHIHDPAGFQKAEAEENEMPPGFELLIRAATSDHSMGVCIQEGPSVEEVKKFVDSVVGPYSKNEYFEMTVHGLQSLKKRELDRLGDVKDSKCP